MDDTETDLSSMPMDSYSYPINEALRSSINHVDMQGGGPWGVSKILRQCMSLIYSKYVHKRGGSQKVQKCGPLGL